MGMLSKTMVSFNKFISELQTDFDLKGIFFDMDGVLFDSMPLHAKAWTETLANYGIHLSEKDPYMNEGSTALFTVHKMFQKYLGKSADELTIEKIRNEKHERMAVLPEPELMPGMKDVLSKTEELKLAAWVVTGSAQQKLLRRLEIEFNGILKRHKMVTALDVAIGKPDPEPYLKAMDKSGLGRNNAIVIENAPLGVQSAKAAGLFTIAINSGLLEIEDLYNSGADVVFENSNHLSANWTEIIKYLKK